MHFQYQPQYLLDGLSSLIGAWSVDYRLSKTYHGNAVQVLRTSDSGTQDIGFEGMYVDKSSGESFCSGTDGVPNILYDQSGNGRNLAHQSERNQSRSRFPGSAFFQPAGDQIPHQGEAVHLALDHELST